MVRAKNCCERFTWIFVIAPFSAVQFTHGSASGDGAVGNAAANQDSGYQPGKQMMSNYATLLTLDVAHSYHDGLCRDFDYMIPLDTALLLRDSRMSVKIWDGRLTLFWPRQKSSEPLLPLSGCTLRFGLRLLNPSIANETRIAHDSRFEIPLYRNTGNSGVLDSPLLAKWSARSLCYLPAGTAWPLTVSLETLQGRTLLEEVVFEGGDTLPIPFDLADFPLGSFLVVETSSGATHSETHYLDPDLRRMSAYGIAEITVAEDFYTTPAAFTIQYQTRAEMRKFIWGQSSYGVRSQH